MRIKPVAFLALLALVGTVFAALSSDQALDIVGGKGGYLNDYESAKLLLQTPIEINGERYWVAYVYQTSSPDTKNLQLAVSDNTGFVERDPIALTSVFQISQKLAVMDQLKQGKASLDDVDAFLSDAQTQRQSVEQVFYTNIRQQLEPKYTQVSFDEIANGLQEVKDGQDALQNNIRETRSLKGQFELYGTGNDFDAYFNAFNTTLGSFNTLSLTVERYQSRVLAKVDEVTNSRDLNFSAKEEITTALEKTYDVGDYKGFRTGVVEPAQRLMASQLARQDTLVANNVESTLYRIAKKNAEKAYSTDLKDSVTAVLASAREPELKVCGIDASELKKVWAQVRTVMENPSNSSRATYDTVPEQAAKASTLAADITQKLNDCTIAATPPPQRADYSGLLSNALILVVVAGLGYYGYTRYKKWRQESDN
jgi:hypothetical protein